MSKKNSNDNIGNRTRYLPACSAVPAKDSNFLIFKCLYFGTYAGLKMKVVLRIETSVTGHPVTKWHIPKECITSPDEETNAFEIENYLEKCKILKNIPINSLSPPLQRYE
jgi:hypothetical protein